MVDQALAPIRQALEFMLAQQEPFPAVVVDQRWNLIEANKGAVAMVRILGRSPCARRGDQSRRCIGCAGRAAATSQELGRKSFATLFAVWRRMRRRIGAAETVELRDRLTNYPGAREAMSPALNSSFGGAGSTDVVRKGTNDASALHDHRDARYATRHHRPEFRPSVLFPMDGATRATFEG